ncbi:unnamed protein product, partial [Protopolystoma xenopodis]
MLGQSHQQTMVDVLWSAFGRCYVNVRAVAVSVNTKKSENVVRFCCCQKIGLDGDCLALCQSDVSNLKPGSLRHCTDLDLDLAMLCKGRFFSRLACCRAHHVPVECSMGCLDEVPVH